MQTFTSNFTPNLAPNFTPNLAPNITPNIAPNITPNIAPNLTPNLTPNIAPNMSWSLRVAALQSPQRAGPPLASPASWLTRCRVQSRMPSRLSSLLLCGLLALGGCASVAPQRADAPANQTTAPTAATAAPASASARTQAAELLTIEQQWLQGWFRGTPVRFAQRSDGTLAIEVPREFCFEAGRSRILPALSAVLDKVAQSLHRRPTATLSWIAGPADPAGVAGPAALGLQRATALQRHLRDRGIAAARLAEPLAEGSTGVQLRISMAAP